MKHAVIKDGVVVNLIVLDGGEWTPPEGCFLIPESDSWNLPRSNQDEPIQEISKAQFALQLDADKITGTLEAAIERLPDPALRKEAKIRLQCTTMFSRDHPLIEPVGALLGMDSKDMDEFFRRAARW